MKKIKLTQSKIALINNRDYLKLSKFKWFAQKGRKTYYACRRIKKDGKRATIAMHTQILGIKNIDHKNGNGLDNRRCNLRPATKSQNQWNRQKRKNSSSIYKGVCWFNQTNCWRASIKKKNKSYHLGYFECEVNAALAYNKTAKKLFGRFARLNIIND